MGGHKIIELRMGIAYIDVVLPPDQPFMGSLVMPVVLRKSIAADLPAGVFQ